MEVVLTDHQREIADQGIKILQRENRLLIKGSAGVGKTTLVNQLVKELIPYLRVSKVCCSAPTNKAVRVLSSKMDLECDFSSTHSALKMKKKTDNKTGEQTFKPDFHYKYPPLKGVGLLVIDEASMLHSELLGHLEEYATAQNTKVIFLGDSKQLPPIGEEISPVFTKDYPTVELVNIIRQGEGNPIIELSRNLGLIHGKKNDITKSGYGYVFTTNIGKIIEELSIANGTDICKYTTWTNIDVNKVNMMVRNSIYSTPELIELGETLVLKSPYANKYITNEEIKIEELKIESKKIQVPLTDRGSNTNYELELKLYCINPSELHISGALPKGLLAIHEDSLEDFTRILNVMAVNCKNFTLKWTTFYEFKQLFIDFNYNHAGTVHFMQGSTVETCFINLNTILNNPNESEKEKMLYTAITRASKLVVFYV